MSLERSPPRARFETVHPETPEQTSATHPAVTMDEATQQNPPRWEVGLDRTRAPTAPSRRRRPSATRRWKTPTPPKRSSPSTTLTPRRTRGGAADRATNHDASRDSENLAFRDGGAHPYVEDQSMGESEDERSDSDSDSASDSDDDRTDDDDDALIDVWDGDPPLGNLDPSYLDLGSFSRELVRAPRPSAGFLRASPTRRRARAMHSRARTSPRAHHRACPPRTPRVIVTRSNTARAPRAAPAPPPPNSFGTPSLYRASCPIPRASLGVRFSTLLLARLFPLEPDAETNPPHPRRRRAVSRRG